MPRGEITAGFSMHPDRSHAVGLQIMLAGGSDLPGCLAYIDMEVDSSYSSAEVAETQVRIRAQHADGTPAGQINGPGAADDVGSWRNRYVPFLSDSRPGPVKVWFEVLGPNNQVIATSNTETIEFVVPEVDVSYGEWKPSGKAGMWERPIYASAYTEALGFLDFSGTPVRLEPAFVPGSGAVAEASWFSKTSGKVINGEDVSTGPDSGQRPFTAMQYWRETPEGTRQLNVYRVRAVVDKKRLLSRALGGKTRASQEKDSQEKDAQGKASQGNSPGDSSTKKSSSAPKSNARAVSL